ncbi:lipopolysaccharide heptosyltransferase II [Corallincola luteus]|uniref:lipopolysaccharide heptosyltransferase II n=1 Tax=Corallincola luteus TaxID=1775177 RepID=A0ABY2AME0_9GAMM|nr:lipopolysaccharide heptosyltransferase II [Corallincola luteus]TCI04124.1 lipopolysaccharide heptosyltransferase II [Corallincola luteus]
MKYLVVGPAWVGDMVMAQSLFKQLQQDDAEAIIDVVAPTFSLPILQRMPEVNDTIDLPFGHGEFAFSGRRALGKSLRERNYDKAIILPRSFKSALVPYYAEIPVRVGFGGELRSWLLTDVRKRKPTVVEGKINDMTVKRFLSLGLTPEQAATENYQILPPVLETNTENRFALMNQHELSTERPIVCICPGAEYGPAKQWPVEYHAELARQLVAKGYQVWVLGSPKEMAAAEQIAPAGLPHLYNFCGKTKLADTIDLFSMADAVVSHDSGLMHVAAATGVFTVAIYGSSSPEFTPPLSENKQIIYLGIDCSPCFKKTCPLGHYNCLKDISVEQVLNTICHSEPQPSEIESTHGKTEQ